MPLHDWTKVDAGIFHDFHSSLDHSSQGIVERGPSARRITMHWLNSTPVIGFPTF